MGFGDFIEDIIHPEHEIYGLRIATVAVKPPCIKVDSAKSWDIGFITQNDLTNTQNFELQQFQIILVGWVFSFTGLCPRLKLEPFPHCGLW